MMFAHGTVLPPKEFRREMKRMPEIYPKVFKRYPETDHDRVARNLLYSNKVWERADYGPMADVREVIALRIAPWLGAGRPRHG